MRSPGTGCVCARGQTQQQREQDRKELELRIVRNVEQLIEPQVAAMVCFGKATDEIAEALHISCSAVSFHRANLRPKLGLPKGGQRLATRIWPPWHRSSSRRKTLPVAATGHSRR